MKGNEELFLQLIKVTRETRFSLQLNVERTLIFRL